jgi:hypothetical protein
MIKTTQEISNCRVMFVVDRILKRQAEVHLEVFDEHDMCISQTDPCLLGKGESCQLAKSSTTFTANLEVELRPYRSRKPS